MRIGWLLAAVCCVFGLSMRQASAQDDALPTPDALTMRVQIAHPEYVKQRDELVAAVSAFTAKAQAFNTACGAVPSSDTAAVASCQSQYGPLIAERAALLARLKAFHAAVDEATQASESPPAGPHPQIGGSTEIQGTVYWETSDGRQVPVRPGSPIYFGEHVVLGPDAHAKFVLKDDTTFQPARPPLRWSSEASWRATL